MQFYRSSYPPGLPLAQKYANLSHQAWFSAKVISTLNKLPWLKIDDWGMALTLNKKAYLKFKLIT